MEGLRSGSAVPPLDPVAMSRHTSLTLLYFWMTLFGFVFLLLLLAKVKDALSWGCSLLFGFSNSFNRLFGISFSSNIEMFFYLRQAKICLHGRPKFEKQRHEHSFTSFDTVYSEEPNLTVYASSVSVMLKSDLIPCRYSSFTIYRKENTSDKRQINRSRPKNKNPTFFEPRRE